MSDTEPTFTIATDVQFAPPPEPRKPRARSAPVVTLTPTGALSMDEAPRDGTRLWVEMSDGTQIDAFWCRSRRFSCNQWSDASWWAYWGTRTPVADNIVGWHTYDQ